MTGAGGGRGGDVLFACGEMGGAFEYQELPCWALDWECCVYVCFSIYAAGGVPCLWRIEKKEDVKTDWPLISLCCRCWGPRCANRFREDCAPGSSPNMGEACQTFGTSLSP